uniref:KIAA0408 n=1 Tax=Anisakis simplex TaxID=6269 RepID=A0A0M3JJ37_ANISI
LGYTATLANKDDHLKRLDQSEEIAKRSFQMEDISVGIVNIWHTSPRDNDIFSLDPPLSKKSSASNSDFYTCTQS